MLDPVSYRISEEDYVNFAKLQFSNSLRGGVMALIGLIVVLGLVISIVDDPASVTGAVIGAAIGLIAFIGILRFLVVPWQAVRAYREYVLIQEEMTFSATDDRFTIEQESGSITAMWKHMVKWNENDEIFAIHPNRHMAFLVPKHNVTRDHIEMIRLRLIGSGLGEKGKMRQS